MYYIYKKKYNKEINSLNTNDKKWLEYKNLRLNKWVNKQETDINNELFKNYFKFQRPSDMFTLLNKTNDTEENNKLVSLINSGLKDVNEEIKKMSEAETKNEKPGLIVEIVEKILKFNKQNQHKGQRIKILTQNQMLNRLPIALAQLQAGNNSNKLKNEIRQLLYSLYCSQNVTDKSINVWLVLFKKNDKDLYEYRE